MNMSKKSKVLKFLKNSSENTVYSFMTSVRRYEKHNGMSIDELVCEALDEQTRQVPQHMLKIIERIESFQESLVDEGLVYGTVKEYVAKVKTVYHKNRVAIPYIEPLNPKTTKRREYIEYKDVLTKDELRKALPYMRLPSQARLYAMAQGGLSNEECEHLTTRAFIDETYCYHKCDDDVEALKWLADENHPIIWVTRMIRMKTKKPYYAILGPESVNKIAKAKLYELELPKSNGLSDKLLNTHKTSFGRVCRRVNKICNFGLVAEESKLRPHNLRRFHATHIGGSVLSYEENSIISSAEIDEMQGRGKTATQDTYIKSNPIRQKMIYAKVMNNLSLYHKYDYEIVDGDVVVRIHDQELENKNLQDEVRNLSEKLAQKEKASEKVDALRNELGDDVFKELINEILSTS